MARTLQAELDQIAEHADTTTRKGLHYILTEACLALLRHPDYCTSGLCKCDVKDTQNDTEEQFNQLSLEERGKFDEETLVNFNSLRRHVMAGSKGTQFHNEYIVVRSSAPCSYNSCYMQGHLSVSRSLCAPSNLGHCLSPEGHGKYSFTSTLFLPPVWCVVSP
jgi:hypothetical protein